MLSRMPVIRTEPLSAGANGAPVFKRTYAGTHREIMRLDHGSDVTVL
jgi:hypothetical protein